jgi:predicted enzyme related to lactoylglutathione lyase
MKHTIMHFEIPADDVERAKTFYKQLLGWQISPAEGFEDYWLIQTGEEGQDLGGGLMKRQAPGQGPVSYVQVESVTEYATRVQKLGGQVIVPKSPVPGMGWFAHCMDTESNIFALWEDDPSAA